MITENCPPWCVADHPEPGEAHRSSGSTVPVVAWVRSVARAEDLVLEVRQSDDDPTPWCYLGDGMDQHLELSLESARRLSHELMDFLARLDGGPGPVSP